MPNLKGSNDTSISKPELNMFELNRAVLDAPPWILGTQEKIMLIALIRRGEEKRPTFGRLRNDTSIGSDETINDYKGTLQRKGWLDYAPGNHRDQRANLYTITVPEYVTRVPKAAKVSGNPWTDFEYPDRARLPQAVKDADAWLAGVRAGRKLRKASRVSTADVESHYGRRRDVTTADVETLLRQTKSKNALEASPLSIDISTQENIDIKTTSIVGGKSSSPSDDIEGSSKDGSGLGFLGVFASEANSPVTTSAVVTPKDIHMWQRRNSRMMRVDDGSPKRANEIDGGWIDDDYLWLLKDQNEIYS